MKCAVFLVVAMGVGAAQAATVDDSIRRASTQLYVLNEASSSPPYAPVLNETSHDETFTTEKHGLAASIYLADVAGGGYTGLVFSIVQSEYVLPNDPGIGGPFGGIKVAGNKAEASVTQTDNTLNSDTNAFGDIFVTFTLTEPTAWSFTGHFSGEASGAGESLAGFALLDMNAPALLADFQLTGTFDQGVSLQGVLPAGTYEVVIRTEATNTLEFTTGTGYATAMIYDALFLIPEPHTAAASAAAGLLLMLRPARRMARRC